MSKIRLSYSLLALWKAKRYEDAIKMYLHVDDREPTDAMIRGINFDRMAKDVALREHRLPDELGSIKIEPEIYASEKVIASISDEFDLSAEFDIRTKDTIIELKCSEVMDSADYMNTLQLPFYLYVASINNLPVTKGMIYRYDPSKHTYDVSIMYPSKRIFDEVADVIETYAHEIQSHFKMEGVV